MAKYKSVIEKKGKDGERFRKLVQQLRKNPHVKAGVLADAGKSDENPKVTVAQVAMWNEFGTQNAPARPFMRYTSLAYGDDMKRISAKLLRGIIEGRFTIDQALDQLGLKAVNNIKEVIVAWDRPKNAESTIIQKARKSGRKKLAAAKRKDEKKGSSGGNYSALLAQYDNPLVDTGQLLNSINYEKVTK